MTVPVELNLLQGHWEGQGPGGDCSVTISDTSLRFYAREDHWFETTFTLELDTQPQQLHATIVDESTPDRSNVGTVVVAVFEVDEQKLSMGVLEDFDGPPTGTVVGGWDRAMDQYFLERAEPRISSRLGAAPELRSGI